jgi:CRP/FNR family cyclic AMP-dependent transcriptional regulator
MFPLLELDPELGRLVPAERRENALRELRVELSRLPRGDWSLDGAGVAASAHVGLLLVEGVVSREVVVADCVSTELLGPGDVLRPWGLDDGDRLLRHAVRWNALTDSRVAVLDRRFGAHLTEWPEVNVMLIERLSARARRHATTQAISQLSRVERRLSALFWHLAERWGRVTAEGVVLPLTLSHRMLGQLVGARRPTVSTALAKLAEAGQVQRRDNGTWLLLGDPVGLPLGTAAQLIGRRHPSFAEREQPAGVPAQVHASTAEALTSTSMAELRQTLERLRSEAGAGVESLRAATEQTQALVTRLGELRAQRARAHERRTVASA